MRRTGTRAPEREPTPQHAVRPTPSQGVRGRTGSPSGARAPVSVPRSLACNALNAGRCIAVLLALTLVTGCADRTPQVPTGRPAVDSESSREEAVVAEFPVPAFEEGRTLDTIIRTDDGRIVAVASIRRDSLTPQRARADRIELFAWNSADRAFAPVDQQGFHWVHSYRLLSAGAGRRSPVLLVFTDGGGNDPLATRGATIITLRIPVIPSLRLSHGAPESVAARDTLLLLARARFLPPLAGVHNGYEYVDAIVRLEGDSLRDVRNETGAAIVQGQSRTALERYQQAIRLYGGFRYHAPLVITDSTAEDSAMAQAVGGAPQQPSPLCLPAAEALIALERAGNREERDRFWKRERPRLRPAMSPVELAALDSLARLRAH